MLETVSMWSMLEIHTLQSRVQVVVSKRYLFHCLSHYSLSFSFVISFHPVLEIIEDFGVFVVAHVLTHSIVTGLGAPMQHFWRRGT